MIPDWFFAIYLLAGCCTATLYAFIVAVPLLWDGDLPKLPWWSFLLFAGVAAACVFVWPLFFVLTGLGWWLDDYRY